MSDDFESLLEDASAAMLFGDLDDADDAYADAEHLATTPIERAKCLEGRATIHIARGAYAHAIPRLRTVLELYGTDAPASTWGNLGFALDHVGAFDEALVAHQTCLELHAREAGEDHPRALRKLGDLAHSLVGLGRLDEAEAALQRMVDGFARDPDREPRWFVQALRAQGQFFLQVRRSPARTLACVERAFALRDACTFRHDGKVIGEEGLGAELEASLVKLRDAALAM